MEKSISSADFRSDTVTIPGKKMLRAMLSAKVGDMVLDEDIEVNALEKRISSMFGMEAAAFCPSGTMTNQIAVNVHTRPGDEVICSSIAHIYLNEGGGIAFNSGASVALINSSDGTFTADDVLNSINPDDPHKAHTSLVCVENTVNRGGGKIWNYNELVKISKLCREKKLMFHLDGARLFNAVAETGIQPPEFGKLFDSVSVCLSKGLGAPVGSLLIGSKEFIYHARRRRKVLGGTMRQAGYLAAAGLYALDNNIERLATDHQHARQIARALGKCSWVDGVVNPETNIVIFTVAGKYDTTRVERKLASRNILVNPVDRHRIRMVTHLDITGTMVDRVCRELPKLF